MTASELIAQVAKDGVTVSLTEKGRIRLTGDQYGIDRWLLTVNQYSESLIAELSRPNMTERS